MARTPIVAPRKELHTDDQKVGQDVPRDIPVTGEARVSDAVIEPVPAGELENKAKLDLLRFMEDVLTVRVETTSDKYASNIVQVWNDGRAQRFLRGQEQQVKRKFVEVLARAKLTSYRTEVETDRTSGEPVNRAVPTTGLLYPFSVLADPAGERGKAWLKNVLSEA